MGRAARKSLLAMVALTLVVTGCSSSGDDDPDDGDVEAGEEAPEDGGAARPGESTTSVTIDTTGLPTLGALALGLEEVAEVDQPTAMTARSGYTQLYIAERTGNVRELTRTDKRNRSGEVTSVTYKLEKTPVLDLTDEVSTDNPEQGLLGITFSPDGRRLYVDYTNTDGDTRVVEYTMSDRRADARSARTLLEIDQPAGNHNGGHVLFGPDGFLYVGTGDGGDQGDPDGNGQNTSVLLAKILRIDPDDGDDDRPYGIPPGNPFGDGLEGAPEVWIYGVRNPWRFSFDAETDDLWIADVGGSQLEEITLLPRTDANANPGRGANLGWDRMEGDLVHEGEEPPGHVGPLFVYDHDLGCSVTGGFVYRGETIEALRGVYLYGDFCGGEVRGIVQKDGVVVEEGVLGLTVPNLSSFAEDADGELFALSHNGTIFKIVPA